MRLGFVINRFATLSPTYTTIHIAYEAYFNNCTAGDVESNLYRPAGGSCARQNSRAGDVYRELWGA